MNSERLLPETPFSPQTDRLSKFILNSLKTDQFRVSESPEDTSKLHKPDVPATLRWSLWLAMGSVCLVTLAGITVIFLAGFGVGGFELAPAALAALAGGMTIQAAAAIVSPLARGIADVIKEQYKLRQNAS